MHNITVSFAELQTQFCLKSLSRKLVRALIAIYNLKIHMPFDKYKTDFSCFSKTYQELILTIYQINFS